MVVLFLFALALIIGSYAVMVRAVGTTNKQYSARAYESGSDLPFAPSSENTKASSASGNRLSSTAMEQVIDCYAGKPVYLDPEKSRPLYPSCEQLLRIYQGQTTDPQKVLALLAEMQGQTKKPGQ